MARPLSDSAIARLKAKKARFAVQDPITPGLELRITPKGVKSWNLRQRDRDGKQHRRTLGQWPEISADDARGAAGEPVSETGPITLERLVDAYLERWSRPNRKTTAEDERVLKKVVLPHFGEGLLAHEIKRRDLNAWRDEMVSEGKAAACNRYYAIFRTCLRWALSEDLLDADPTSGLRMKVKETPRDRLTTDDELKLLWHGLATRSKSAQHAVRLALATGLRIGEIVSAEWAQVGPEIWTIPATKTKARMVHLVPISDFLRDLLDDVKQDLLGEIYVFPGRDGGHLAARSPGRVLNREFPEMEDLRIHDFRRVVGSWIAEHGFDLNVTQFVLGHAPAGVTQRHYIGRAALLPRAAVALKAWQTHLALVTKKQDKK